MKKPKSEWVGCHYDEGEDECSMCAGEYCATHACDGCDCDAGNRHMSNNGLPGKEDE